MLWVLVLMSSLVLTACNDSETAAIRDASDETSLDEGDRGEQAVADRDCDTAADLPLEGISGLSVPPSARPDRSAEILALDLSGEAIAPEALYQRIVAELAGLRSAYPRRTDVEAEPCFPGSLIASFGDSRASTELFDTYNTLLRSQLALLGDGDTLIISFDGIYNTNTLAAQYEALPNIEFATPEVTRGDNSDICVENLATDSLLYIFDQGTGDCASGCLQHNFSGFTVDADGNISDLGSFQQVSEPQPAWYTAALDCRTFL